MDSLGQKLKKPTSKIKLIVKETDDTNSKPKTTIKTNSAKIEDIIIDNQQGGKQKKIDKDRLGVVSKKKLRDFKNERLGTDIKRMNYAQYRAEVDLYNKFIDANETRKKQDKINLLNLPYVDNVITKEERKKIQREEFLKNERIRNYKKLQRDFVNMRKNDVKNVTIKMNDKLDLYENVVTAIKLFEKMNPDLKINLKVGKITYALNANTKERLFNLLENQAVAYYVFDGSDAEIVVELTNVEEFEIEVVDKKHKNKKDNGAFFKYINISNYDLTRYQIFNKILHDIMDMGYNELPNVLDNSITYNIVNYKNIYDNCLLYALRIGGMENEKLELLKLRCRVNNIPVCKFDEICEELQICIKLTKPKYANNFDESITETYGNEINKIYHIGLLEEHYFIIEPTNITSFSIENYEEIKEHKHFNLIYRKKGKYYEINKTRCISSYDVIRLILKNKFVFLKPINKLDVTHTQLHKGLLNEITNLDYEPMININYREIKYDDDRFKKEDKYINIFYDFESYTKIKDDEKLHIPYLCVYITDDSDELFVFYGEDCGYHMLNQLSKKYSHIRLIAHNASYDNRFLYKYISNINEIEKGKNILSSKSIFKNMKIVMKDSYAMMPEKLSNFVEMFKMKNMIKEVISYNFYNETNAIEKVYVKIDEFIKYLLDENKDVNKFLENIKKWNLIIDDEFNCVQYAKKYCEIDCLILKEAYNKFKIMMKNEVDINIDNKITIASLAHSYFIKNGCYEGVYEIGGIPQMFIQKCVVGGRTMTNNNEKYYIKEEDNIIINDFDAVSLYPTAMNRMEGFLKGLPKVIKNFDRTFLDKVDGYFIEIKILKVNKKRELSLMSYLNENGVRIWTNEMENKNMFVDKTGLEDLIEFHKIEFEIIRGYYFDEGFNVKIKEEIKKIFDLRLHYKKLNNPTQTIYKLIMNSGYGKSIMKEIETETRYFNKKEDVDIYISRNYNWIQEIIKLDDCNTYKVKTIKAISNHFNIAQVGVCILSMSKRIMNEVICLAEDNKLKIYYQDTDSIHIEDDNIQKLRYAFNKKYDKELIGKNMGQFHSDFNINNCKNIVSVASVFLGKKCYINKLRGIDNNTNEIVYDYHIRCKGVDNDTILWTTKKLKYKNVFDLYVDMYKGKSIDFDLTQEGKKSKFKYNKDATIKTLKDFTRTIKF